MDASYNKKVTREYKDSIFTKLFSDKQKALELYNAVGTKKYDSNTEIEINTLDDVLYLDRINDVSFILDGKLIVLVEHQSSINANMPMRFLIYISKLYENFIASNELNIYREKLIKVPKPEFICLYNGTKDYPDGETLKLSDSFYDIEGVDTGLDLAVKVININKGRNETIVKQSKVLSDYIFFIDRVRNGISSKIPLKDAIDSAVKYCIENNILIDFLETYRAEVMGMLTTEFDMNKALEARRLDGYEEGKLEGEIKGEIKGKLETAKVMLSKNTPLDFIIEVTNLSRGQIESLVP